MKKTRAALLIVGLVAIFVGWRWWAWVQGRILASVDASRRGKVVIREIPYSTNPIYWMFDASDHIYRMEFWGWPHIMTDCTTFREDSFRANSARIEHSPERTTFYLDDLAAIVFTADGGWTVGQWRTK